MNHFTKIDNSVYRVFAQGYLPFVEFWVSGNGAFLFVLALRKKYVLVKLFQANWQSVCSQYLQFFLINERIYLKK